MLGWTSVSCHALFPKFCHTVGWHSSSRSSSDRFLADARLCFDGPNFRSPDVSSLYASSNSQIPAGCRILFEKNWTNTRHFESKCLPSVSTSIWKLIQKVQIVIFREPKIICIFSIQIALFRNKRFMIDKMFQRNASKYAIFLEYENPGGHT